MKYFGVIASWNFVIASLVTTFVNDQIEQVEEAADEGDMPPLEGAEEDASRMEEVWIEEVFVILNIINMNGFYNYYC